MLLSSLATAGPSAVPLLVEIAVAVAVGAGIVARRPVSRLVAALVRRPAMPRRARASGPAPGA